MNWFKSIWKWFLSLWRKKHKRNIENNKSGASSTGQSTSTVTFNELENTGNNKPGASSTDQNPKKVTLNAFFDYLTVCELKNITLSVDLNKLYILNPIIHREFISTLTADLEGKQLEKGSNAHKILESLKSFKQGELDVSKYIEIITQYSPVSAMLFNFEISEQDLAIIKMRNSNLYEQLISNELQSIDELENKENLTDDTISKYIGYFSNPKKFLANPNFEPELQDKYLDYLIKKIVIREKYFFRCETEDVLGKLKVLLKDRCSDKNKYPNLFEISVDNEVELNFYERILIQEDQSLNTQLFTKKTVNTGEILRREFIPEVEFTPRVSSEVDSLLELNQDNQGPIYTTIKEIKEKDKTLDIYADELKDFLRDLINEGLIFKDFQPLEEPISRLHAILLKKKLFSKNINEDKLNEVAINEIVSKIGYKGLFRYFGDYLSAKVIFASSGEIKKEFVAYIHEKAIKRHYSSMQKAGDEEQISSLDIIPPEYEKKFIELLFDQFPRDAYCVLYEIGYEIDVVKKKLEDKNAIFSEIECLDNQCMIFSSDSSFSGMDVKYIDLSMAQLSNNLMEGKRISVGANNYKEVALKIYNKIHHQNEKTFSNANNRYKPGEGPLHRILEMLFKGDYSTVIDIKLNVEDYLEIRSLGLEILIPEILILTNNNNDTYICSRATIEKAARDMYKPYLECWVSNINTVGYKELTKIYRICTAFGYNDEQMPKITKKINELYERLGLTDDGLSSSWKKLEKIAIAYENAENHPELQLIFDREMCSKEVIQLVKSKIVSEKQPIGLLFYEYNEKKHYKTQEEINAQISRCESRLIR